MKQIQFAVVVVAFASFSFACGGDPLASRSQALEPGDPIGTFEVSGGDKVSEGSITRLVLMTDGTARVELGSSAVIDGFYKKSGSSGEGHLDFVDGTGTVLDSCDYRYDGKTLDVVHGPEGGWQSLEVPVIAFCETPPQCDAQALPHLMCYGLWSCINNGCQFQCHSP
ncbi:MAG TPA: hypothetical protein VIG99_04325 [Myxococcaceae bacterium]|jgi:hypothetical protein